MSFKFSLFLFLISFSWISAEAQETWSLKQCIDFAKDNNISIKQAQLGVQSALLTQKQFQYSRLPSLDAGVSAGVQFGRTIDPTTNSFDNQTISFNSLQLNTGMLLSNGNRINNSIKQAKVNTKAAEQDVANAGETLVLGIASTYLTILMADEQLLNARGRLRLSEQQLDQMDKLIRAGMRPENERLSVVAQIALEEQNVITIQNMVEQGYLQLKNLLQMDPSREINIERPAVEIPENLDQTSLSFGAVYSAALQTQSAIRAAEFRKESADIGVNLAKAGYYPSLTAFAGIDTRWSSVGQTVDGFTTERVPITAYVNGDPFDLELEQSIPNLKKTSYSTQLNENFGQSVGLSLQIPIYSNHQNVINVERARIGSLTAEYAAEQVKQQLKTDVQSAVASARAAQQAYAAAQKSFDAAKAAFENADKKFQLGALNIFEHQTARTNYDNAQTELVRSKYDFLFRLKIIDIYLGREVKF